MHEVPLVLPIVKLRNRTGENRVFNTVPFKSKLTVCCEPRFSTRFAILDSILVTKFRNGPISCYDQLTWHGQALLHLNSCCYSHGYSTVYSRCMFELTIFITAVCFTFLILKTKMAKKQKYLPIKFSKITISIRINLLLQVRPSELSLYMPPCV